MHGPVQQWLWKLRVLELSLPWQLDSCIHYRLTLLNYSVTIVTSCACVSKAFMLVSTATSEWNHSNVVIYGSAMCGLSLMQVIKPSIKWHVIFNGTYHNMQDRHLYILTVIHQCYVIQQQLPTSCCPSSTVALQILKWRSTTSKQPVSLETVMYKFSWHPFLFQLFVHRYCTTSDTVE